MKQEEAEKLLIKYEDELLSPRDRIQITLSKEFFEKIPTGPGVYLIFDAGSPVYVGETGSLQKRMKDLRQTRNHNLRRLIGEKRFSRRKGYEKATSRKKYTPQIEELVVKALCAMEVKLLETSFGRKEIEEYLVGKLDVYNRRKKRR